MVKAHKANKADQALKKVTIYPLTSKFIFHLRLLLHIHAFSIPYFHFCLSSNFKIEPKCTFSHNKQNKQVNLPSYSCLVCFELLLQLQYKINVIFFLKCRHGKMAQKNYTQIGLTSHFFFRISAVFQNWYQK